MNKLTFLAGLFLLPFSASAAAVDGKETERNDTVYVGYGTIYANELSTSAVHIDKCDFIKGALNSPLEMLTGKVAGLNVDTVSPADPNSLSDLQIRGVTSLYFSCSPLIVIDGIPGADIRSISAQDIESVTVLKDVASTAIYGMRGADGVILIQTRKSASGEPGRAHITYDSWFGVNIAKPYADVLSAEEFRQYERGTDYGYDTDWYGLLMRDFPYDLNQYLAIDGTTRSGSYSASINYRNATGLDITTGREEFGGRVAVEQRAFSDRLSLGMSLNARRVNEKMIDNDMFYRAVAVNPTSPVYNEDGSWHHPEGTSASAHKCSYINPYQEVVETRNNAQRLYLSGAAQAKVKIIDSETHRLNTSVNYSLDYKDVKSNHHTPAGAGYTDFLGYDGYTETGYQKWWSNSIGWLVDYSFSLNDHNLKAVAGYIHEEEKWESVQAAIEGTTYGDPVSMSSEKSLLRSDALLARLNYNWRNIVIAYASVRYENSTQFADEMGWAAFPSASLAWELAEMSFLKDVDAVQSIKPRLSYGVNGRFDIDMFRSSANYSEDGIYTVDNLKWEKLVGIDAGIDFSFFGSRLRGSLGWFTRRSQDLIYTCSIVQPPYVHKDIPANAGVACNTGVEVSLTGGVFRARDFIWDMGAEYSYGSSTFVKLSDETYDMPYIVLFKDKYTDTYFFRVLEGEKVGQFYGYEYAGISERGEIMIYDGQGEKIPSYIGGGEDGRFIGNGTPCHFLSWSNTFRYRNWDLGIIFRGAFGFEIMNMRKYRMGLRHINVEGNALREAYLENAAINSSHIGFSSYFLERGDYFKLENLTLGYSFIPGNREILESLRVYLSARNLFTLTGYTGNDPSTVAVNGLTPGVDAADAYPSAAQVTLGVTMRF